MKTYFLCYKVLPLPGCEQEGIAKGAYASFWIVDRSPKLAQERAENHLRENRWQIHQTVEPATPTTHEQQIRGEIGETHYLQAQREGFSVAWLGWAE